MASKSLYLMHDRREDDTVEHDFDMCKFDMDFNAQGKYEMTMAHTNVMTCNCPARAQECRHVRMLDIFLAAQQGVDELYNQVSDHGNRRAFLAYNGKLFDWVDGGEIEDA